MESIYGGTARVLTLSKPSFRNFEAENRMYVEKEVERQVRELLESENARREQGKDQEKVDNCTKGEMMTGSDSRSEGNPQRPKSGSGRRPWD